MQSASETEMKENDYVRLAFAPEYIAKIVSVVADDQTPYADHDTYSNDKIDELLLDKEAKKDVRRTAFIFDSFPSNQETFYDPILKKFTQKGEPLQQGQIDLSPDEFNALMAFAVSSEGRHAQGGVFSADGWILFAWLNKMDITLTGLANYTYRVVKSEATQLSMLYTAYLYDPFTQEREAMNEDTAPIVIRKTFNITKQKHRFSCVCDQSEILIKKVFWQNRLLDTIMRRLNKSAFSKIDIVLFVPFLSDKQFAAVFFEKLNKQPQERINEVNKYIFLCFELTFWQKNKAKIVWPVLVSAFCGFGLFVMGVGIFPLIGGTVAGLIGGGLLGNFIDTRRMIDFTTLQMPPLLHLKLWNEKHAGNAIHITKSNNQAEVLSPLMTRKGSASTVSRLDEKRSEQITVSPKSNEPSILRNTTTDENQQSSSRGGGSANYDPPSPR